MLFLLTYKPIIMYLKMGGDPMELVDIDYGSWYCHPILQQLKDDVAQRFGYGQSIYLGGATQLRLHTVREAFTITEYDGNESVNETGCYCTHLNDLE